MKKSVKYFTFICLAYLLSGCSASYNVIHITYNNKEKLLNKEGFYYNLPQTALKVDVTIKQSRKIKGPYAEYAEKLLGLNNIIEENSVNYAIANFKISSVLQVDPSQFYFVETAGFSKRHKAMHIKLSEDGMIESINSPDKTENTEINAGAPNTTMANNEKDLQLIIGQNLSERIDTIIEKVTKNDSITIEKKTVRKTMVEKTSEQKAREIADYLMKIKSAKYDIITGVSEIPYSKETLEFMINQLNKQETEYLKLFLGDTSSTTLHYTFTYLPKKGETYKESLLFVFSPKEGIMKTPDATGEVVTITVSKNEEISLLTGFQSQIDKTVSKENGFYYRIPESARVSIHIGNTLIAETTLPVSQLGVLTHLPFNMSKVLFYPNTGAIKAMSYE